MTKYLSCAETAKMVRTALKEAFPKTKFSVKSSTYSMGASIGVRWTDGPNSDMVDAVVKIFNGSYFDGMIDYKGSIYHMIDGEQVSMGADSVRTSREDSDEAIQRAIDALARRYAGNWNALETKPTVEDYKTGKLWSVPFIGSDWNSHWSLQSCIGRVLHKHSFIAKVLPSKTAGKVIIMGDDNYSATCGSGFKAVSVE